MKDSPLRNYMGILTIVLSLIIGIYTSSFIWGIGVFLGINIVIAPIIKFLELKYFI